MKNNQVVTSSIALKSPICSFANVFFFSLAKVNNPLFNIAVKSFPKQDNK